MNVNNDVAFGLPIMYFNFYANVVLTELAHSAKIVHFVQIFKLLYFNQLTNNMCRLTFLHLTPT